MNESAREQRARRRADEQLIAQKREIEVIEKEDKEEIRRKNIMEHQRIIVEKEIENRKTFDTATAAMEKMINASNLSAEETVDVDIVGQMDQKELMRALTRASHGAAKGQSSVEALRAIGGDAAVAMVYGKDFLNKGGASPEKKLAANEFDDKENLAREQPFSVAAKQRRSVYEDAFDIGVYEAEVENTRELIKSTEKKLRGAQILKKSQRSFQALDRHRKEHRMLTQQEFCLSLPRVGRISDLIEDAVDSTNAAGVSGDAGATDPLSEWVEYEEWIEYDEFSVAEENDVIKEIAMEKALARGAMPLLRRRSSVTRSIMSTTSEVPSMGHMSIASLAQSEDPPGIPGNATPGTGDAIERINSDEPLSPKREKVVEDPVHVKYKGTSLSVEEMKGLLNWIPEVSFLKGKTIKPVKKATKAKPSFNLKKRSSLASLDGNDTGGEVKPPAAAAATAAHSDPKPPSDSQTAGVASSSLQEGVGDEKGKAEPAEGPGSAQDKNGGQRDGEKELDDEDGLDPAKVYISDRTDANMDALKDAIEKLESEIVLTSTKATRLRRLHGESTADVKKAEGLDLQARKYENLLVEMEAKLKFWMEIRDHPESGGEEEVLWHPDEAVEMAVDEDETAARTAENEAKLRDEAEMGFAHDDEISHLTTLRNKRLHLNEVIAMFLGAADELRRMEASYISGGKPSGLIEIEAVKIEEKSKELEREADCIDAAVTALRERIYDRMVEEKRAKRKRMTAGASAILAAATGKSRHSLPRSPTRLSSIGSIGSSQISKRRIKVKRRRPKTQEEIRQDRMLDGVLKAPHLHHAVDELIHDTLVTVAALEEILSEGDKVWSQAWNLQHVRIFLVDIYKYSLNPILQKLIIRGSMRRDIAHPYIGMDLLNECVLKGPTEVKLLALAIIVNTCTDHEIARLYDMCGFLEDIFLLKTETSIPDLILALEVAEAFYHVGRTYEWHHDGENRGFIHFLVQELRNSNEYEARIALMNVIILYAAVLGSSIDFITANTMVACRELLTDQNEEVKLRAIRILELVSVHSLPSEVMREDKALMRMVSDLALDPKTPALHRRASATLLRMTESSTEEQETALAEYVSRLMTDALMDDMIITTIRGLPSHHLEDFTQQIALVQLKKTLQLTDLVQNIRGGSDGEGPSVDEEATGESKLPSEVVPLEPRRSPSKRENMVLHDGPSPDLVKAGNKLLDAARNQNLSQVESTLEEVKVVRLSELLAFMNRGRGSTSETNAQVSPDLTMPNALNFRDSEGRAAIHIAAANGSEEILKELILEESALDIVDNLGKTPLILSTEQGHVSCIQQLLSNGCNPDAVDKNGMSSIKIACLRGDIDCMNYLLAYGSSLELTDSSGDSALLATAKCGREDVFGKLIAAGADVNQQNKEGDCVLFHIIVQNHKIMMDILLRNKANLGLVNNKGMNGILMSAVYDNSHMLQILTENGQSADCTDNKGNTAIMTATRHKSFTVLDHILNNDHKVWTKGINQPNNDKLTPLHVASWNGDLDILKFIMAHGGYKSAHMLNTRNETPLMLAAFRGHTEIVGFLYDRGSSITKRNVAGRDAVLLAASNNHLETLAFLAGLDCDLDSMDCEQCSPLMLASRAGFVKIVSYLLGKGVNLGFRDANGCTAYSLAVKHGWTSTAKVFFEFSAAPDVFDNEGRTPIMLACQGGHIDLVEYLVMKDANRLLSRDREDNSALMLAARHGRQNVVSYLVKFSRGREMKDIRKLIPQEASFYGIDMEQRNHKGQTALMLAAETEEMNVVFLMLTLGAKVNAHDAKGWTALMHATANNNYRSVTVLLGAGADNEIESPDGDTSLIIASQHGHEEVLKILLEGIDEETVQSRHIQTALTVAIVNNHINVVAVLIDAGANLDAINSQGHTPLTIAIRQDRLEILRLLLSKRADVVAREDSGMTPLMVAAQEGKASCLKELLVEHSQPGHFILRTKECWTVLHYLAGSDNESCCSLVLKHMPRYILEHRTKEGKTALMLACEQGAEIPTSHLLSYNANGCLFDMAGDNSLILASRNGHVGCVKSLLRRDGPLRSEMTMHRNYAGRSALCEAVHKSHLRVVELLLQELNSTEINIASKDGITPLMVAVSNKDAAIVRLMAASPKVCVSLSDVNGETALDKAHLQLKSDTLVSVLSQALDEAHGGMSSRSILNFIVKPYVPADPELITEEEMRPASVDNTKMASGNSMIRRCYNGQTVIVKKILQDNPSASYVDSQNGFTPLMAAASGNQMGMLDILITMGQDVNQPASFHTTFAPLHIAVMMQRLPLMTYLIKKGARVDIQSSHGYSPLMLTCQHGYTSCMSLLLVHNADHELTDWSGRTPLIMAACFGKQSSVEGILAFLVAKGRKSEIPAYAARTDSVGENALMKAARQGNPNVLRILLNAMEGGRDQRNLGGMNAAMIMAQAGNLDSLKVFLKGTDGSSLNVRNSQNCNTLAVAVIENQLPIIEFLVRDYPMLVSSLMPHGVSILGIGALYDRSDALQIILDVLCFHEKKDYCAVSAEKAMLGMDTPEKLNSDAISAKNVMLGLPAHHSENNEDGANLASESGMTDRDFDEDKASALLHTMTEEHNSLAMIACHAGNLAMLEFLIDGYRTPIQEIVVQPPDIDEDASGEGIEGLPPIPAVEDGALRNERVSAGAESKTSRENEENDPVSLTIGGVPLGADLVNVTNNKGYSPLYVAAEQGLAEICSYLLSRGAHLYDRYEKGITVTILAASLGHVNVLQVFDSVLDLHPPPPGYPAIYKATDSQDWTALHNAACTGMTETVEFLIPRSAPNQADSEGLTPLVVATLHDRLETVTAMMRWDCIDVNVRTKTRASAVSYAAQGASAGVINIILASGNCHVEMRCDRQWTPLMYACSAGNYEAALALLSWSADIDVIGRYGNSPLILAAACSAPLCEALLAQGAKTSYRNKKGVTALMNACERGTFTVVESLLDREETEADIRDMNGKSALMMAAQNHHVEIVRLLIAKGASVNLKDKDGLTALHLACQSEPVLEDSMENETETHTLLELLVGGAKPWQKDALGRDLQSYVDSMRKPKLSAFVKQHLYRSDPKPADTMFENLEELMKHEHNVEEVILGIDSDETYASSEGITSIMMSATDLGDFDPDGLNAKRMFIEITEGKVDINARNKDGDSALALACLFNNWRWVEYVIDVCKEFKVDLDMNSRNMHGCTPLMLSALHDHERCVATLLKEGVEVDYVCSSGLSALSLAAWAGNVNVVDILLTRPKSASTPGGGSVEGSILCNTELVDIAGNTPLMLSASCQHVHVVQKLLAAGAKAEYKNQLGLTPLMVCAAGEATDLLELLMSYGALVSSRDNQDWSALMHAVANDRVDNVLCLLNCGADPSPSDYNYENALMLAARLGSMKCLKIFLEMEPVVNEETGVESVVMRVDDVNNQKQTSLVVASAAGTTRAVSMLLKAGASIEWKDCDGRSALFHAVQQGHEEIVQVLLNAGAVLRSLRYDGVSPFQCAVIYGHLAIAQLIKDYSDFGDPARQYNGVSVDEFDESGNNPIHHASQNGHDNMLKWLISLNSRIDATNHLGETPLFLACAARKPNCVQILVENGAQVNHTTKKKSCVSFAAVASGDPDIVKIILDAGGFPYIVDGAINTHLHIAAKHGSLEVAKILVGKSKSFLSFRNIDGNTPLHCAIEKNEIPIVNFLLENGSDVNCRNGFGLSPLCLAARRGIDGAVGPLVSHGANMSLLDKSGLTALMNAAKYGHGVLISNMLVEFKRSHDQNSVSQSSEISYGEFINYTDRNGNTALMHAASKGNLDCIRRLVRAGVDVNLQNDEGNTALQIASTMGHRSTVGELVNAGARVNMKNYSNETALGMAVNSHQVKAMDTLLMTTARLR